MTKRDYELIAKVVADAELPKDQRARLAMQFAAALRGTNERFDVERFTAACMGETTKRKAGK
jgi:hypothetical protein